MDFTHDIGNRFLTGIRTRRVDPTAAPPRVLLACSTNLTRYIDSVAGPQAAAGHSRRSAKKMKIRKALLSDVDSITSVLESTSEVSSVVGRGRDANLIIIRTNLEKVLRTDTSTVLVAESGDGRVIGYCAVHWTPFLFLEGGEAYVTELFIHRTNRAQGVGSNLLSRIEREAKERGCSRISLLNGKKSEAYERGFYRNRNWVERDSMANFILNIKNEPNKTVEKNG